MSGTITLTQSNGSTAVSEGGANDTYTLVLDSAPSADVVITLNNTNKQAASLGSGGHCPG